MTSITHIISGLNTGGAETMLYKLLSNIDRTKFELKVLSLTDIGSIGKKIEKLGISVKALDMKRGVPDPRYVFRLAAILKKEKPDLVQTWMYHADLIGGLAAKLVRNIPIVWNIRHSNLNPEGNKKTTILTAKACAKLSKTIPKKIICCSEASFKVHSELGYEEEKMIVIPNGFDLDAFKPDTEARYSVRRELRIPDDATIIGMVARFDPQKDHKNLIDAAGVLCRSNKNIHFILCGDRITNDNKQLAKWIQEHNLQVNFHLLGLRAGIARITTAFDIASSSSYGEGFPNVVGEAMSCEVPCVVTNVGDSAYIVGITGIVVPPKNPLAMAKAWEKLIKLPVEEIKILGKLARKRIEDNFEISSVVNQYEVLYNKIL